jgi:hypothetical protein
MARPVAQAVRAVVPVAVDARRSARDTHIRRAVLRITRAVLRDVASIDGWTALQRDRLEVFVALTRDANVGIVADSL